jgi:short subunit dehydrogenase-like uncharacterized protein
MLQGATRMDVPWMLYGANGYTGQLIVRGAVRRGLQPILAGRSRDKIMRLADELGLQARVFDLRERAQAAMALKGMRLVLHCAGPFSAASALLISACLTTGTHYLDITGEIDVLEYAHEQGEAARTAGIVICPGVGFDVIPTDCVAAKLKSALPNATHLALGFHSGSALSPGTGKTLLESLAKGGKVRKDGRIVTVPLAHKTRRINYGTGEMLAMTIPWGDVSTAFYTTGIPTIEVYTSAVPALVILARIGNHVRWLLGADLVQRCLKRLFDKILKGPGGKTREVTPAYVWGEVSNEAGQVKSARIMTANGYSLTVSGALAVVEHLMQRQVQGGAYTPAKLVGPDLLVQLPGSGILALG